MQRQFPVRIVFALALVAWVALPVRALAVQTISDGKLGFSFSLPDGFAQNPTGPARPRLEMAFMRGQPSDTSFAILQLGGLGGTIGRDKLDPKVVEESAQASVRGTGAEITHFDYRATKWKELDLELVVARVSKGNQHLVTLTTQIPLASEALQLNMVGPAADEAKLLGELQSVLTSLHGKSNWLSDSERSERLGRLVGIGVGVALPFILVLILAVRRRKHAQRTAVS